MIYYLNMTPRDPIIARDGRPFGAGQGHRMRSLDWPYPSVLAGSLRTLLGKMAGGEFKADEVTQLKAIEIAGPLPVIGEALYFPAPKDIVVWEDEQDQLKRKLTPLSPLTLEPDGSACDLPKGLSPVIVSKDIKPVKKIPAFWSCEKMIQWLKNPLDKKFDVPTKETTLEQGYLYALEKDERFHVKIDPEIEAAEEGLLFMTVGLDCTVRDSEQDLSIATRVEANNGFSRHLDSINSFHPFGGERRLLYWEKIEKNNQWEIPPDLKDALENKTHLRLVLATPALFETGWKPGWLNEHLEGCPPGTNILLRLRGACVDRWSAISGWSLEKGKVGPKAVQRLLPAGSVYFFEILEGGSAQNLAETLWLRPISDDVQERRDGFGLALWGLWKETNNEDGGS